MTVILKATPVSQVASDISAHIRSIILSNRTPLTELAKEIGVDYPRFRYFVVNPGLVPSDADLAKLIKHYMPGYVLVPSMVVPVNVAA